MLQLLERVAQAGPPRNTEICHKIQDDVWEFIKGRVRVFWFYDEGRVVVCTHGMIKSTQRTPKSDIEHAVRVKAEYFSAKQQGRLVIEEDNNG